MGCNGTPTAAGADTAGAADAGGDGSSAAGADGGDVAAAADAGVVGADGAADSCGKDALSSRRRLRSLLIAKSSSSMNFPSFHFSTLGADTTVL